MTKNNLIEAGSYISLSAGFYVIAPHTIQFIEKYITNSLCGLTLIITHSVVAAILIRLYFRLFPLQVEKPSHNEIVDMIRENPNHFKLVLEEEFIQYEKKNFKKDSK